MLRPVVRRTGPRGRAFFTLLLATSLEYAAVADSPDPKASPRSGATSGAMPQPKTLSADDASRVAELNNAVDGLWRAGRFAEAVGPARQALAVWEAALGPDHWGTANARRKVETLNAIAGLPEEGRRALAAVPAQSQEFLELRGKARSADAEQLARQILEVRRRWLGEDHPDTASSYNDLATVLDAQGKLDEAEVTHRKALALRLKELGKAHPDTASSYVNLAIVFQDQGRLVDAEVMHRTALALRREVLGEASAVTAASYNNLANVLRALGKPPEAEATHRKALALRLRALGEAHPDTAQSYNNLANVLATQGKLSEAEAMHRKGLAIYLKVLGEAHPDTARSYSNLGAILRDLGKLAEAEAISRKALELRLKALGEAHPLTTSSYNNLANVLGAQGKLSEAEAMHRKALELRLKALGEAHALTASSYHNVAEILRDQGRLPEAEAAHRQALACYLKALGEAHPDTARNYANLAQVLDRLGRADEALDALTAAFDVLERARLRGAKGLESALDSTKGPTPELAVALARVGREREAWGRWERGLARAVLDEVARPARPLTPEEKASEADLLSRSQTLDERISRLASRPRLNADEEQRLEELRREASELRRQLLDLQQALEQKYGPLAGKPATLGEVQAALADDTALVGWVDTERHHAACVVRRSGDPAWVMIPGSGKDEAWTKDEETSAGRLRDALAARAPESEQRPLAEALARQRLGPLETHLKGVKRVVVVNSPGLAGVPVEVLFAARGGMNEPGPMVSYAPSSSMFVHLVKSSPTADAPATLLALGDPAYPAPWPGSDRAPPPPDHGLLVARIEPNGNADLSGIKADDVLLEYNGTTLKTRDDLKVVAAGGGPNKVPLKLWRAGEVRPIEVAAGPLGVGLDTRPAAPVVLAQRAAAEVLRVRGGPQSRLPGTRREVAAIAGLFPAGRVTTILGDDARESVVQGMARAGKLKGYRYLHFAAHGRDDPRSAYRTALLLAPDPDPSSDPAAFDTDGEVTAEQIARTWELDADLVVLSACESALGKQAGGEGFLGFAQPLLAKGARDLVLSLWKVDDRATSLLMTRFFQNLLGKRPGLSKPRPKAEALDEAKRWLRELTVEEVGTELAALERGPERPLAKVEGPGPVDRSSAPGPSDVRPYAHPYYWASFILIGDPQ
jgi:CHAT domain-containing protein/Flp pilus assembly protein TadD